MPRPENKCCPFCGGKVQIYYSSFTKAFYVDHVDGMGGCILLTPAILNDRKLSTLEQAYGAWNRRFTDDKKKVEGSESGGSCKR